MPKVQDLRKALRSNTRKALANGWSLIAALVLLIAAAVALAPMRWARAVEAVAAATSRFWAPALLTAAGVAILAGRYLLWQAVPRMPRAAPMVRRWPLFGHVSVLLLAGVVTAGGMGMLLWWGLGSPSLTTSGTPVATPTPNAAARPAGWSVQNTFDAIKIVLSLVAGIGAVVALTMAYRKQAQSEAAEHREDTKLFTERFTKASEQLGSDKAAVRLAGVYALTGLADDWREGRQTCIEVLCAYLRMPYVPPAGNTLTATSEPAATPRHRLLHRAIKALSGSVTALLDSTESAADGEKEMERQQERQVRHTILNVIGEHLRPPHQQDPRPRWHGHRFDMTSAVIDGGDFRGIDVPDNTELDFGEATFCPRDRVEFSKATFSGGQVSFAGATFSSGLVAFGGTDFFDGDVIFVSASFCGGEVNFSGASFSGSLVAFGFATFSSGRVLLRASFNDGTVDFNKAEFTGAEVDFTGATFLDGQIDFQEPAVWQFPPVGVDPSIPGARWPTMAAKSSPGTS